MNTEPKCPKCGMENTYFDSSIDLYVCPDCSHEFNNVGATEEVEDKTPRDSNGTELQTGDSVTLIKDLKVRGSSVVLKRGTKVKGIHLTEDPEEVDCKIDGTSFVLKTCFLKK
jgi:protein PhnA